MPKTAPSPKTAPKPLVRSPAGNRQSSASLMQLFRVSEVDHVIPAPVNHQGRAADLPGGDRSGDGASATVFGGRSEIGFPCNLVVSKLRQHHHLAKANGTNVEVKSGKAVGKGWIILLQKSSLFGDVGDIKIHRLFTASSDGGSRLHTPCDVEGPSGLLTPSKLGTSNDTSQSNEKNKQDGAHEPECKHDRKATYVQMTLL